MAGKKEQAIKNLKPGRKPGTKPKKTKLKEAILAAGGEAALADPMEYFRQVMADSEADQSRRDYAASQLLPYFHSKKPTQISGPNNEPIQTTSRIELVSL